MKTTRTESAISFPNFPYFFSETAQTVTHTVANTRARRRFFKNNPYLFLLLGALLIIGIFVFSQMQKTAPAAPQNDGRIEIQKAKAEQIINKTFSFPLRDGRGVEVSKLKFVVENAELRDEIIVKGKRATSVKGRTFLIVNVKITNDFNQPVSINSRDYMRLIVNNSSEKLAADIHNDPVEIQAISTKYSRLGFPINDSDKKLVLQVGEIDGSKQTIQLQLK